MAQDDSKLLLAFDMEKLEELAKTPKHSMFEITLHGERVGRRCRLHLENIRPLDFARVNHFEETR